MSEVKKRSEMDPAYMWAMTDLYPDDEAWEKELGVLEGRIPEYRDYEGKLGESAEKLGSFFKFSDEIGKMSARVYVYANQMLHQDMAEAKYQDYAAKAQSICVKISAAQAFFVPELLEIPEEKLDSFIKEDKEKKQKDILHISLQLKNEDMAEFTCDKEVMMRNQ